MWKLWVSKLPIPQSHPSLEGGDQFNFKWKLTWNLANMNNSSLISYSSSTFTLPISLIKWCFVILKMDQPYVILDLSHMLHFAWNFYLKWLCYFCLGSSHSSFKTQVENHFVVKSFLLSQDRTSVSPTSVHGLKLNVYFYLIAMPQDFSTVSRNEPNQYKRVI